jgi:nucleotide-binding universal stress UspA family protein
LMLQQLSGAHLHVLHAYDLPAFIPPTSMLLVGELNASLVEHAERATKQHLFEFLAKLSLNLGDTLSASVEVGPTAATIVAVADRERVDLIVMGTHGRTGWSRALMGSTAEKVLHAASCPVLTIKAHATPPPAGS